MEYSNLYIVLLSVGFSSAVIGSFYLSAQAIGFVNLKQLEQSMSLLIDIFVANRDVYFVDTDTQKPDMPKSTQGILKRGVKKATSIVKSILFLIYMLLYFLVIHAVFGIILVILWLLIPPMFGLVIPIWLTIIVALVLYIIGGHLLGEVPHTILTWLCKYVVNVLQRHFKWIEQGTIQSGRTGIVGFLLLFIGLTCQFVAYLFL